MADDVSEAEKTRRIMELQRLQGGIQRELFERLVGTEVDVLVEGMSRRRGSEVTGRTAGWVTVNLPGSVALVGQIVRVRVTEAAPNSLRGELIGGEYAH